MKVSEVRFKCADSSQSATGLLGYITCVLDGKLRMDGITLRRTADGRLCLSYPARRDREGRDHPYMRPIDHATRIEIEGQVFNQLSISVQRTAS